MEAAEDEEASMKLIFGAETLLILSFASRWKMKEAPLTIFWNRTTETIVGRFILFDLKFNTTTRPISVDEILRAGCS